jgi:hypothetical protein
MNRDLDASMAELDELEVPDLRSEIESQIGATPTTPDRHRRRCVLIGAGAAVLVAVAAVVAVVALNGQRQRRPSGNGGCSNTR